MLTPIEPGYPSIWSHLARVKFQQGWINAGGVQTRFCQAGSSNSPPLIMVHGMGASWECFAANIGPLSEHFNVVAFDTIGAGFSDKPNIAYDFPAYAEHIRGVADAFSFDRFSAMGLSVAGNYLAHFAYRYPDRVNKLVMIGTLGVAKPPGPNTSALTAALAKSFIQRLRAVEQPTWENVSPIMDGLIHDPGKRIADFVALRQRVHRLPGMVETMKRVLAITDMEKFSAEALTPDQYSQIVAPVLVTCGEFDNPTLRADIALLASVLPQATLEDLRGVGHWPQWEAPEAFNSLVISFLHRAA